VIDLHERLSEYSYGYGVTREVELLLKSVGLVALPFLPSLLQEKVLGFDVGFKARGRVVLLQFKLGHELHRYYRASPTDVVPTLRRPFWRYNVDTSGHQFTLLRDFELAGAETYYVAPRFSTWQRYEAIFASNEILENSLLLRPSEISRGILATGGTSGPHKIVYDPVRRYVRSKPSPLEEEPAKGFADRLAQKIRGTKITLGEHVETLLKRVQSDQTAVGLSSFRLEEVLARARSREEGVAAAVALEAWAAGAQAIFVTAS
jgi:hypothetical protein